MDTDQHAVHEAIRCLARQKRWAQILFTLERKVSYTFRGYGEAIAWGSGQVATLRFVPFPPRPRALVYFGCSMNIIYRLEMNLGFDFQI